MAAAAATGQAWGEPVQDWHRCRGSAAFEIRRREHGRQVLANCAHPSHFADVLPTKDSRRSPAELDEAKSLDPADPEELGSLHRDISAHLPRLAARCRHGPRHSAW